MKNTKVIAAILACATMLTGANLASAESFKGKASGITVDFEIDLPEGYDNGEKKYPVIYVLHSWGRTHNTQFKCTISEKCDDNNGSAQKFMQEAVAAGKMEPSILVYPNGMKSSFFADSFDGKKPIETSIIDDLIPYIDATYRTKPGRTNRAVMGLRLGGYGATLYGLKHPDKFAAAVSVAGALHDWYTCIHPDEKMPSCMHDMFNGNYSYYLDSSPWHHAATNTAAIKNYGIGIRLTMGDDPELKMRAETLGKHLTTLGIPYEYEQVMSCTGGKGPNRPGRNFNCIQEKGEVSAFEYIGAQMKKNQAMK